MIKYEANADPKCLDSDLVVGGRFSHIVTEVAALVHGVYQPFVKKIWTVLKPFAP